MVESHEDFADAMNSHALLHGGGLTYAIPRNAFWGSYAVELELTVHDDLDPTKIYVLHSLTHFDINPLSGFGKGSYHVPPTYRVSMTAWNGDER